MTRSRRLVAPTLRRSTIRAEKGCTATVSGMTKLLSDGGEEIGEVVQAASWEAYQARSWSTAAVTGLRTGSVSRSR
ncbi:hypothetical protein [Streptomyces laculatispora]|uniref:hypothetical protein n=1 Tax=Streptomyces laculatispora TaxID=887464 RepID=UPI001A93FE14|nr:hypothetical protein [Streptomyces laculatispora]MBO0912854.1 hypothetical protein [Streptomyces laculatispora]